MRVDREKLKLFIRDIRITEMADEITLTDPQIAELIADYLETDPKAINFFNGKPKPFWEEDNETHNYE